MRQVAEVGFIDQLALCGRQRVQRIAQYFRFLLQIQDVRLIRLRFGTPWQVLGFRSALVDAGSQTQVVSLWLVADEPTRYLMTRLYQHLAQGAGRAAALSASPCGC